MYIWIAQRAPFFETKCDVDNFVVDDVCKSEGSFVQLILCVVFRPCTNKNVSVVASVIFRLVLTLIARFGIFAVNRRMKSRGRPCGNNNPV